MIRRPIQSNVRSEFGFGRDALFHAERLRKDNWKNYKDRSELRVWRNNLPRVRELSELTNLEYQIGKATTYGGSGVIHMFCSNGVPSNNSRALA